ncbi:MAG: general secretion pathway protein GspK [Burkholderiales bacterium]|nr:general secretion pathway protein GspK [Burkholderiales bacterium]
MSEKIPLPQNMRGMALILVLWMIVLLVLMASGFAFAMRSEAVATQTSVAQIKAGLHVDGAIERAVYELARPKVDPNDGWKADGTSYPLTEDEADLTVTIVDESSFIDINAADEHTLKRLFERVGGVDARTAESIVNALLDWRDADDLTRPFGAEAPEYRAAHKNHAPSNTSFRTQEELGQVLGVTPQIYANVAPFITVYSKTAAINTTTAPREVLLCLPQADEDSVDRYIEDRRRARDQGQALPLFHGMGGKSPIWRITATLKSDEGFTLTRTAIIRYTGQSSRPFLIYDWRDA